MVSDGTVWHYVRMASLSSMKAVRTGGAGGDAAKQGNVAKHVVVSTMTAKTARLRPEIQ